MAQLNTKIKLYLEANSKTWDNTKVFLQDDGDGAYIKSWSYDIAKPNDSQLASYNTAGNTEETLAGVLNTRKNAYKDFGYQLDLLYHDMLADKGNKTGEWFKHIKAVKDANAKD